MHNTDSQRATLRARRDIVKNELVASLSRASDDRSAALTDQVHDTKDQAIAALLLENDDAEVRRAATELQDIDAALARLSAGTYGRCIACGTQIPATRLSVYPTAKRCLPCQGDHERKNKART